MNVNDPKIIVALDFAAPAPALALLEQIDPTQCRVKIGKEMFTRAGPAFVEQVAGRGFEIFLDLKYHDIPNTVAAACAAAADMGVWMMNVHASGGRKMMGAAAERLAQLADRPLLVDTGDEALDRELSGYMRVTTGYRDYVMCKVGY